MIPFKKGCRGGPGRPPKPVCVPDILREIGATVDPKTKRTKLVAACLACFQKAEKGDLDSLKFIVERTEGKVKDTMAIEGGGELTVVTRVVRERAADADGR